MTPLKIFQDQEYYGEKVKKITLHDFSGRKTSGKRS